MAKEDCELWNHLALLRGQYLLFELLGFGGEDKGFLAGSTLLV